MRILVTGSEGYIGSLLVPRLQELGHEVTRLDSLLFRGCNLDQIRSSGRVVEKDIRDVERDDVAGHEAIIHLAGLSNDPLSEIEPSLTREINHAATVRLAELARESGVMHFVNSSTCSVYGFHDDAIIDENSVTSPLTVYAESKIAAERDLNMLACDGLAITHLRHGTVYGASPMTRFDLVLNNLVAWAKSTGKVHLKSTGNAWRPLVHVGDVCSAFVAAIDSMPQTTWRHLNIGKSEDNIKIIDLAKLIAQDLGLAIEISQHASPDNRSYRVDSTRATRELPGFAPSGSIISGIAEVAQQYDRANLDIQKIEGSRFGRVARLRLMLEQSIVGDDLRFRAMAHG